MRKSLPRRFPKRQARRLEDFAQRIGDCLEKPEARARKCLRGILDRLIPAIEEHRRIEDMSIGCPPPLGPQKVGDLLGLLTLQHDSLLSLSKDARLFLEHPEDYPFETLRASLRILIQDMNDHFQAEEARLRPYFKRTPGRRSRR